MESPLQNFSGLSGAQQQALRNLEVGSLVLLVKKASSSDGSETDLSPEADVEPETAEELSASDEITETVNHIRLKNRAQYAQELDEPPFWEFDDEEAENRHNRMIELFSATRQSPRPLSVVAHISSEQGGHIYLLPLTHSVYPEVPSPHGGPVFQIYRDYVSLSMSEHINAMCWQLQARDFETHDVIFKPQPRTIRNILFKGLCAGACKDGWLPGIDFLPRGTEFLPFDEDDRSADNVKAAVFAKRYKPVCPFCLGFDLAKEHWKFFAQVRIQACFEDDNELELFLTRLNNARQALGYTNYEFISTEWFDNLAVVRTWLPEALQREVFLALPRIRFQLTEEWRKNPLPECALCEKLLHADTTVTKFACGHKFCDRGEKGCISDWLLYRNQCPQCHLRLSYGLPHRASPDFPGKW